MPVTEMVVTIAIAAALVLGFIHILKLIRTTVVHKTIRKAVETDPASAEALLSQIAAPEAPANDDRLAIILVAIGVAMAAGSVIAIDDPGMIRAGLAAALFPLLVGAALWLRLFLTRRAERRGGQ